MTKRSFTRAGQELRVRPPIRRIEMSRFAASSIASHEAAGIVIPRVRGTNCQKTPYLFAGLVLAGLVLRILVAALPGNAARTPWGGGGDTAAYVLLAHNLIAGKGLCLCGHADGAAGACISPATGVLLDSFWRPRPGGRPLAAVSRRPCRGVSLRGAGTADVRRRWPGSLRLWLRSFRPRLSR